MKKYLILGLFLISSIISFSIDSSLLNIPLLDSPYLKSPTLLPSYMQQKLGFNSPDLPKTLMIPKIGISAPVEAVGIDSSDRMDVPKRFTDVGWYSLGVRPGEVGNAVIDGHLDTQNAPAVFANLDELSPGDQIMVEDQSNTPYYFTVTDVATYDDSQFPNQQIFGHSSSRNLVLITCTGDFNEQTKNYSQRFVVYATL